MEHGGTGRFHRYRKHARQPSTSATSSGKSSVQAKNSSNANAPNYLHGTMSHIKTNASSSTAAAAEASQQQKEAAECVVREQDQYMPIANVIRIMRRILPPHAKISDDAKETIQECVSEYISFITGEANDRCQREQRKTITAEDVLWAMGKLGFDDYVEPLNMFLSRYRDMENERSNLRDPILKRRNAGAVDYGNLEMPTFVPSYPMFPPPQGIFDGGMIGGYYRDVSDAAAAAAAADLGGSSASDPFLHFDPFAQFK